MRSMVEGASAVRSQESRVFVRDCSAYHFAVLVRESEAPSTVLLRRTVPLPRFAGADEECSARSVFMSSCPHSGCDGSK